MSWPAPWEALASELEHRTPWSPDDVRSVLRRMWAEGRTMAWARMVLLPAFESARDFERTMAKVQSTIALGPADMVRFAERIESLAKSEWIGGKQRLGQVRAGTLMAYLFRRVHTALLGRFPCCAPRCGRPTHAFTVACRFHGALLMVQNRAQANHVFQAARRMVEKAPRFAGRFMAEQPPEGEEE